MSKEIRKIITNPASGEKVTFLNTSTETKGEKTLIEIELEPKGDGPPPHYHKAYSETFQILEGELTLKRGKELIIAQKGETFTVNKYQKHTFRNDGAEPARFQITVLPGHEGFENALTILFGLARDGLVTKNGAPKNVVDLLVLSKLSDSNISGPLSFLPALLGLMIGNKKLEQAKNKLLNRYCIAGAD